MRVYIFGTGFSFGRLCLVVWERKSDAVIDSLLGGKARGTPRETLCRTLKLASRRVDEPLVNVMDSCGRVIPKRVGVSGVISTIGVNITVNNKAPVMFPTVTIYSKVTVNRGKVGCSLIAHSLVTSSARTVTLTRNFSTLIVIPGYSGGMPKLLVTTTEMGMPAIFIDKKPVLTNRVSNGGADFSSVSRTINRFGTNGVDRRGLRRCRYGAYPAYNSYSKVCATGSVGYLARTLNVKLHNGNAVPTICSDHVRLTGETNVTIVRLIGGSIHPHSVVAGRTFCGTLAISVTLNYSAGDVLRVPTITRRYKVRVGLSVTGSVDTGAPGLYRLTPTNEACVRRLSRTNNICTIVGRLDGGSLVGARYGAISNGAINRTVGDYAGLGPRIVHPVRGPCDRAKNVTILQNGLTPRKDIMGHDTITPSVLIFGNPTHIFRYRRSTRGTVGRNGVGSNSIIIVHCRNPGNNPNVERVLGPASSVVNVKLNRDITLVASKHFDNTAENTYVNRVSPRTTDNNTVNVIHRNSVVDVGVPRGGLRLRVSSRRLGREVGGFIPGAGRLDNCLGHCTSLISDKTRKTILG